jgi:Transposase family tnp2
MTALMVLSLKHLYRVPNRLLSHYLRLFRRSLYTYAASNPIIDDVAADPRAYEKVIDLSVEAELFAICPKCASSYPVNENGASTLSTCTFRMKQQECNTSLNQTRRGAVRPRLLFRRRTLDDWIQGLLGRNGVLETVDDVWKSAHGPPHDPASDFWGGSLIREMKGVDCQTAIASIPDGESMLLFSLAVDWYNPFHNKIAGKNASTGVIFMACLNLPVEERFKEENIYLVGVMPGRKQPIRTNEILQPLVTDLLRYWHQGVSFIGIPGIEKPRLVRGALVQVVCDLPAARKITGFCSHSATSYCSVCFAAKHNVSDLSSGDIDEPQRTKEDHMVNARKYKKTFEASGYDAAEKLLEGNPHGVRWSCLNELPYWDPVKMTILDVMHLILLGLCQFHWRRFWVGDGIERSTDETSSGDQQQDEATQHISDFGVALDDRGDASTQKDADGGPISDWADVPDPSPPAEFLEPKKMNAARSAWILKDDEKLKKSNLTISQILCLLKENEGTIPDNYKLKEELYKGLFVSCNQ